jgi:hypothetical protein
MMRFPSVKWWLAATLSVLLLQVNRRLQKDYVAAILEPFADAPIVVVKDDKRKSDSLQKNTNANVNPSLPYFVIHMGPPKTATSSIQEELTSRHQQSLLEADNYMYVGAYLKAGKLLKFANYSASNAIKQAMTDLTCHSAVHKARATHNTMVSTTNNTNTTTVTIPYPKCWHNFLQALDESEGKNILISQEIMSFRLMKTKTGLAPVDWEALQQALSGRWNLLVVVGYRRLTEWVPSAKQQNERWSLQKPAMNGWPGLGNGKGQHSQPLFPYALEFISVIDGSKRRPKWLHNNGRMFKYLYTNNVIELLDAAAPNIPVKILNLHLPETLLVSFFCQVLPGAEKNCASSRQLAAAAGASEKRVNPAQSAAYDMLATAAAGQGLVDRGAWSRRAVAVAARGYHERVLNRTRWILQCPRERELKLYLNSSLRVEEELLPDFYATDAGEKQHRADFSAAVARKKYCWIDANAVLKQSVWRDFFLNTFSSKVAE